MLQITSNVRVQIVSCLLGYPNLVCCRREVFVCQIKNVLGPARRNTLGAS